MNTESPSERPVYDLQRALILALDSLKGRERGIVEGFLGFSATFICKTAAGYLLLRQGGLFEPAKLMVRPCIETMFKIQAVRTDPALLYKIAYTERVEDNKLARPAADVAGTMDQWETQSTQEWARFKAAYEAQFPEHPLDEREYSAFDAAKAGGVQGYYQAAYRLYSQYTHAALRATTGDLAFSDKHDNRVMAVCVLSAIMAVEHIGGDAPTWGALSERVKALEEE